MLKILTGMLTGITERKTKNGTAVVVDITKMLWEKEAQTYVPGETISIWYCNDTTTRIQTVLKRQKDYLNKTVILMANTEEKEGKTLYYGRLAPTTYGLLRVPVQINPEATADDFVNADLNVSDCQDAGLLDSVFTLNLEEKNTTLLAENIWGALSVLQSSKKNGDFDEETVELLDATVKSLYKLIIEPSAAYIGMVLSHTVYDKDAYPNINLSVTIPVYTPGAPKQWCNCKVFKPKKEKDGYMSSYTRLLYYFNKKVIKDGDKMILYLSNEQARNQQIFFTCYAYQRV